MRRPAEPLEHEVDEELAVNCVGQRLAHAEIVERRLVETHHHVHVATRGHPQRIHSRCA